MPVAAFADFSICDDTKSWYVCDDVAVSMSTYPSPSVDDDCMASCFSEVLSNTEIADSTTVTGENTQLAKVTTCKPVNDGRTDIRPSLKVTDNRGLPYEVGWPS